MAYHSSIALNQLFLPRLCPLAARTRAGLLLLASLLGAPLCPARDTVTTNLSALAPVAAQIQAASTAGFVAVLGWGDGQTALTLAQTGRFAVHVLEQNPETAAKARALLQERGLYGFAVVEWWPENFLPYADDLFNAVVIHETGGIALGECLRVTAPLGGIWQRQADQWRTVRKPWPAEFDEWTHARHGADGNMTSADRAVTAPASVRWVAGPPQDDGGRKWYYDHVLVSAGGRNYYVFEDRVQARDAFNGRLLWEKEAKAYTYKETGSPLFEKLGTRTTKVRPVAGADRLYLALDGQLVALNAADGRQMLAFGKVEQPRDILLADERLLVTDKSGLRAFAPTGKSVWRRAEPVRKVVAGDGKVLCLVESQIVCLDAANGQELWRVSHRAASQAVGCTWGQGVLVLEQASWKDDAPGNGIVAFNGADGAVLWEKEYTPGMTHYKEARSLLADGLLWLQMEKQQIVGFDPATGQEKKRFKSRGLHCAAPVATERFFIAPESEFTDLETGAQNRARLFKSACRLPFVPANGLLNTFPVQCECFPMLRGYMGLSAAPKINPPGAARLQKGSGGAAAAGGAFTVQANDWPMYRRDVFRSGYAPEALPGDRVKLAWKTRIAQPPTEPLAADWRDNPFVNGVLTPPVCAGEIVLVAVPDRHLVVALNAADGSTRWRFVAGGRIDAPPSMADGTCLFGAHDGYVYCLRLNDGVLLWRFRAAPAEIRMAAYGQMESPWPVPGAVLVENSVAYYSAGRHPAADGGVRVGALLIPDGRLLWEKNITNSGVAHWYGATLPGGKVKIGVDYEPIDLLVRDGEAVAMSRWRFQPANGALTMVHTNTNYVAFAGLEVPRGLWSYGIRQTKMVRPRPPAAFTPTKIHWGATNDTALVIAGEAVIKASQAATLSLGNRSLTLDAPVVRDGLAVARRRLYAATTSGHLYCLAFE